MDIKDVLISEESTMIQAMEVLDKVAKKVLFVERNGVLTASITDGDIRRWILAKGNLDAKVKDIANYNPKYIYEKDELKAKEYMKKFSVEALPVVDKRKKIISVALWNDQDIKPKRELDIPVVIMAGGLGIKAVPIYKNPSQTFDTSW